MCLAMPVITANRARVQHCYSLSLRKFRPDLTQMFSPISRHRDGNPQLDYTQRWPNMFLRLRTSGSVASLLALVRNTRLCLRMSGWVCTLLWLRVQSKSCLNRWTRNTDGASTSAEKNEPGVLHCHKSALPGAARLAFASSMTNTQSFASGGVKSWDPEFGKFPIMVVEPVLGSNHQQSALLPALAILLMFTVRVVRFPFGM